MPTRKYFPQYKADIFTKNIRVYFSRCFVNVTDSMSDSIQIDWMPEDDFIIEIQKIAEGHSTNTYNGAIIINCFEKVVKSSKFNVYSKESANTIWKIAKKTDNYDEIVAAVRYIEEIKNDKVKEVRI